MSFRVRVCSEQVIPLYSIKHAKFSSILGFLEDREVCNLITTSRTSRNLVHDTIAASSDDLSLMFLLNQPIVRYCEQFYNPYTNQYIATLDKLKGRVRQLFLKDLTISKPVTNGIIAKLLDPNIIIFTNITDFADNLITLIKGLKTEDTVGKYEICLRMFNILWQLDVKNILNDEQRNRYQLVALNLKLSLPTRESNEKLALINALEAITDNISLGDSDEEDL